MLNQALEFISSFWVILSFSFLVALTGAMSPGPLLTYTIIKSARTSTRGWLMGLWIIIGHAILEAGIIIFILAGFSFIIKNAVVVRTIGIVGGLLLIAFGASIIRDVVVGKISTAFLDAQSNDDTQDNADEKAGLSKALDNPVVGGILVSMSNPYWWVWWATIGLAFMLQFDISLKAWPKLLAFFIGHEAGDLGWYLFVSVVSFFGLRHLNKKIYYAILIICGIFMVSFGLYLGISTFLKDGT